MMSHFLTLVILPLEFSDAEVSGDEVEAFIADQVDRYCVRLKVAPYPTDCRCVGRTAERHAFKVAEAMAGTLNSLRREHQEYINENRDPEVVAQIEAAEAAYAAAWAAVVEFMTAYHVAGEAEEDEDVASALTRAVRESKLATPRSAAAHVESLWGDARLSVLFTGYAEYIPSSVCQALEAAETADDVDRDKIEAAYPWEKRSEFFRSVEAASLAKHPARAKPHPKCMECWGSGSVETTHNLDSKWDFYTIGGRWDGCVAGAEPQDLDEEYPNVAHNMTRVDRLLALQAEVPLPYAIVTPDGEWNEVDKPTEWEAWAIEILEAYRGHLVVVVDMHL